MTLKLPHALVGVLTLMLFLLTGLFLSVRFPDAYAQNIAVRYQFRANHIYVLMSGLLNLMAGALRPPRRGRPQGVLEACGGIGLLAAPAVFVAAFFVEPPRGVSFRPLTLSGVVLALVSVLLLWFARLELPSRADE